jgi:hypothetical protein
LIVNSIRWSTKTGGKSSIRQAFSINAGTGHIDILKWQAFDSASVTHYPTMFVGYYLSSYYNDISK